MHIIEDTIAWNSTSRGTRQICGVGQGSAPEDGERCSPFWNSDPHSSIDAADQTKGLANEIIKFKFNLR
jgi:hypothetical protein